VNHLCVFLITFGLAYSGATTYGPFDLFRKGRDYVKKKYPDSWIETGVRCPICLAFWIGMMASAFYCDWSFSLWIERWLVAFGGTCLAMCLSPSDFDGSRINITVDH